MKTSFLLFITLFLILFVSCENIPGGKPIHKKKTAEENPTFEFQEIYLENLGTEVKVPSEFNLMDTTEVRLLADSLSKRYEQGEDHHYVEFLRQIYATPKECSFFVDRMGGINTIFFGGYRWDKIDSVFLEEADRKILFAPTKEDSLFYKNHLKITEKAMVESEQLKYGKIMHKYSEEGKTWYFFYYFIEGEDMILYVNIRTLHSHGYENMIKTIKVSY